jgi:antitoxin VapB
VGLNIKNERVHALAREVAARTGQSQTSAIETALQRYLVRLQRAERLERLDALIAEIHRTGIAKRVPPDTDSLHDERGLLA